jgi:hypothetical protein
MRLFTALLLFVALACGTAFAASATLSAPSTAHVGDTVKAKASGLKDGRYALRLVADKQPNKNAYCLKRLTKRHATVNGKVTLKGTIPARLTCYQGNGPKLGTVKVTPGSYHLLVSVPFGPTGSSANYSFVRRALKIKG